MSHVIVQVWVSRVKKTSPGHAALKIVPHAHTPHTGYVSFAPVKSGSIYGPGKFYDYQHDHEHYMVPQGTEEARGCWIGKIFGLDTEKMMQQFQKDSKIAQTYSLRNECATQVHKYLVIGGGNKFASTWSKHALASPFVADQMSTIVLSVHGI